MPSSSEQRQREELVEELQTAPRSDVPLDVFFQILSDQIRRRTLLSLSMGDGNYVSFDELFDDLMAEEGELSRQLLSVEMYHDHLPRLADAGLLDIDWDSESVRYRSDTRVELLLNVISRFEGR